MDAAYRQERRLGREFFERPTLDVARELLGKRLAFRGKSGIITETEAYIGADDPACHASRGRTKRTETMFWRGGHAYVYFIYGMYYCLNAVTEGEGVGAAVLIRGIRTEDGAKTDGPGKLTRYLGMTKEQNGVDLTSAPDFFIAETGETLPFRATPRIGITKGTERLWRFAAEE